MWRASVPRGRLHRGCRDLRGQRGQHRRERGEFRVLWRWWHEDQHRAGIAMMSQRLQGWHRAAQGQERAQLCGDSMAWGLCQDGVGMGLKLPQEWHQGLSTELGQGPRGQQGRAQQWDRMGPGYEGWHCWDSPTGWSRGGLQAAMETPGEGSTSSQEGNRV